MAGLEELAHLVLRQVAAGGTEDGATVIPVKGTPGHCESRNEYDGRLGLRISSIFVILVGSLLGAWFPIFAKRRAGLGVPDWCFFIAKYFGSGIIVATAFIHLLAPAHEALTNPCLSGPITEYSWVEGISLMTIFSLFFVELMAMRFATFGHDHGHDHSSEGGHSHGDGHSHFHASQGGVYPDVETAVKHHPAMDRRPSNNHNVHARGEDHLGHSREHTDNSEVGSNWQESGVVPESYPAQLTALFILEFGIVFHSIFIGLTLAVAGKEFDTLYVVLVFHQTFEGLGLGTRLAQVPWPKSRRWTPYLLAIGYGVTTPIAIAIGLAVRKSYPPGSQITLIINGVFDSVSAGILIYTGLVELMAHEFMFSPSMSKAPLRTVFFAFGMMCLGAGLMALLGKWA